MEQWQQLHSHTGVVVCAAWSLHVQALSPLPLSLVAIRPHLAVHCRSSSFSCLHCPPAANTAQRLNRSSFWHVSALFIAEAARRWVACWDF